MITHWRRINPDLLKKERSSPSSVSQVVPKGFTTGPSCDLAVCVPTETHLLLEGIGETVRQACGVGAVEEVVMTRLEGGPYKDAVRFSNGTEISLQRFERGLTAVIVAFPQTRIEPAEVAAQPAVPEYA